MMAAFAELFELSTRPLAHPDPHRRRARRGARLDLHQLRHSMLTHEAENGTSTPTLLARSRHASVRSPERYARPGPEAVARHRPRRPAPAASLVASPPP